MIRPLMLLSEIWTMADPRNLRGVVDMAVEAEGAGWDGVMIGEHVVMGKNASASGLPVNPRDWLRAGNQEPSYPHPSSLQLLGAIAAATERLRLLAAGLLSPLRHPLLLAKELATLDLIAEGRLIVLPTVSWQQEEYAALDVPFERRGRILDEQLEIWDDVWRGSPSSHDGGYYAFEEVYIEPQPYRVGGPTMWIGGASLHRSFTRERIARWADGVLMVRPLEPTGLAALEERLEKSGRSLRDLELATLVTDEFTGSQDLLDIRRALDRARGQVELGCASLVIKPSQFIDDPKELPKFCETVMDELEELGFP